ncbi:MAG: O-antigen ligase family protein [Bdellovibrionota bacterium]
MKSVQASRTCRWLAFSSVIIATVGVTYFYGGFAKLRVGPLFMLDALFCFFAAVVVATRDFPPMSYLMKVLLTPLVFFSWGILLFSHDLVFGFESLRADSRTPLRFVQHAILFVYPFLWMSVGAWVAWLGRPWTKTLVIALLVANALPNPFRTDGRQWGVINFSLGPLLVLPLLVLIEDMLSSKSKWQARLKKAVLALAVALMAFSSFWVLWHLKEMQRSTLLLCLVMVVLGPWILAKFRPQAKPLRTMLIALSFLIAGFLVITLSQPHATTAESFGREKFSGKLSNQFFEAMQKKEDIPYEGNPQSFQMRSRKFWWKTALADWKLNPILGIGFIPEIPSFLEEDMPNSWESVANFPRLRSASPVAGPHNSYLSILARMGVVGLVLFSLIPAFWVLRIKRILKPPQGNESGSLDILIRLALVFVPINGMVYAFFNVGFESPQNCVLLWLFAGMGLGWAYQYERGSKKQGSLL